MAIKLAFWQSQEALSIPDTNVKSEWLGGWRQALTDRGMELFK
ncbi:MAG: ribosome modulation factor [Cognaticolwellia sp.]|jgi:ribosome modulation factor